jgi:two-component system chemotaxis sensor kinase CheA
MIGEDVDQEFKDLFVEDAAIRLDRMSEQLLELERSPGTAELLTSLCREAHSLKGAAGMVGFHDVASVAHALENPLQEVLLGEREVDGTLVDALLAGVDGLRAVVAVSPADPARAARSAVEVIARLAAIAVPKGSPAVRPADAVHNVPAAPISTPRPVEVATMQIALERLDEIDRVVGESAAAHLRVGRLISEEYDADPESVAEYRELARLLTALQELTIRARMVTLSTITPNLHRAVRDVARAGAKKVRWIVDGGETEIDRKILELLLDPLIHLVRNAVDHGIEKPAERLAAGKPAEATVRLTARQRGSEIVLTVADDGHGIDVARVKAAAERSGMDVSGLSDRDVENLIFTAHVSTATEVTEISGRGVGLDVVRANIERLRGRAEVSSRPGQGTEFTVTVPITLAIVECLLVESGGQRFALPIASVLSLLPREAREQRVAGQPMLTVGDSAVPVSDLASTLELGEPDAGPIVVVSGAHATHAFRVQRLVGHRDLVIKGLGGLLPRIGALGGAAIEPDGSIVVVLDPDGLIESARGARSVGPATPRAPVQMPTIMVVDDAITVRELERSILERAGYRVRVATNGQEALGLLQSEPSDLVLTDLEMPVMDGIALTETIRKHPSMGRTPVVILTSHDSDAERRRGLEAGANAYIIKSGFDQQRLLSAVEQLLLGGRS